MGLFGNGEVGNWLTGSTQAGWAGSLWNDISGNSAMAAAQQRAADAQLAQQRSDRGQALNFVTPGPQELAQMQQAISLNSQDIARRQKLIDSADPALLEVGKQTLAMLQGKEAAGTTGYNSQRARQKAQLQNTLAKQLGPDYANSSAGIQALSAFDSETANNAGVQQQNAINSYLGYLAPISMGGQQQGISNSSTLAQMYGNIGTRQANAITGNRIDPGLAFQSDLTLARGQQQLAGLAVQGGLAYLTGGGSVAAQAAGGGGAAGIAKTAGGYNLGSNTTFPSYAYGGN